MITEELNFFNQDKFISENEYKAFTDNNKLEIDLKKLKDHNNNFINRKLIEYEDYFDNIFGESKPNIKLDEEQRRIVLNDDDYCLINAGAGTGKSTTMAAKVKYLIEKLNVKPSEIIMLSFTRKSSEDLEEKVNDVLKLGVPVSTFHSLGYRFIRLANKELLDVAADAEKRTIIENYVISLFENKNKLLRLCELFKITKDSRYGFFKGFIDNISNFNTFDEYFNDYKRRKYEKESQNGGIEKYIKNRLNSKTNLNTINGDVCKSIGEVKIANFLSTHNIDYEYERTFDERVGEDNKLYHPDFTIKISGEKTYIEYFGMTDCFNNNRLISNKVAKYNRVKAKKMLFQKEHPDYDFINIDKDNPDTNIDETLKVELEKRGLTLSRMSDDSIFDKIISNNKSAEFYRFIELMISFISILKNMLVNNVDQIFEKRKKQIASEKIEKKYYSDNLVEEVKCRFDALDFLKEIYYYYQNELKKNRLIDYDDMINESYKHIINDSKNNNTDLKYKYIIVDEYQDITFQRFLFVKRIVEYFGAKLVAVGDDWQSIYSFSGSRLELFNKFSELYHRKVEEQFLSTTYRYGQDLADYSSEFLSANKEQSIKKIKAIKELKNPIQIVEYETDQYQIINNIVDRIYKQNRDASLLLLARTNRSLYKLKNSLYFSAGVGDILICTQHPDANIEAITMHRSKGLTADQVIVFDLKDKVFPSKGKASSWIFEYFRLDTFFDSEPIEGQSYYFVKEKFPFAEERRLFYVALTRTKNKVFLVVPSNGKMISEFVREIEKIINDN